MLNVATIFIKHYLFVKWQSFTYLPFELGIEFTGHNEQVSREMSYDIFPEQWALDSEKG